MISPSWLLLIDEWRSFLYPLGFLSAVAFSARFIVQWIASERAHQSVVPRSFWKLSLAGNLLLMLHSLIQVQYHVCVMQTCNAVISWRNLNLTQTRLPPVSFKKVVCFLLFSMCAMTALFIFQKEFLNSTDAGWFRIPVAPWQETTITTSLFWHLLGTCAYGLFSSRFWVQWWVLERSHSSQLPLSFWWMSFVGAIFSIAYFFHIRDSVNLIGPLMGLIPYLRNLMLLSQTQPVVEK